MKQALNCKRSILESAQGLSDIFEEIFIHSVNALVLSKMSAPLGDKAKPVLLNLGSVKTDCIAFENKDVL